MKKNKKKELVFYATLTKDKGRKVLIIRALVYGEEEIRKIVEQIIQNGKYEVKGVLIFRDPFSAILKLAKEGIIKLPKKI